MAVLSKDGATLISVNPEDLKDGKYIVPAGVKIIDHHAFKECKHVLKRLELPNGLEEISGRAFFECALLRYVVFPHSLKIIGPHAFAKCSRLKVSFHEGLETILESAFAGCDFDCLIFPKSLRNIASNAFKGCAQLTRVKFPPHLEHLGLSSFTACPRLSTIQIRLSILLNNLKLSKKDGWILRNFMDCL